MNAHTRAQIPDFRDGARYLSKGIEPRLDDLWVVRDWIPRHGLSVIYGPSGAGKSILACDMSAHVATGREWHGSPVEHGFVAYLVLEGTGSLDNRIAALAPTFGDAPVWFMPARFSLADVADHPGVLAATVEAEARTKGLPVRLVVVDTLARAMGALEENSSRDMGQAIAGLDSIARQLDCAVVVVHHSGKDAARGERGSGALRAAAEASIELSIEGKGASKVSKAMVQKQRDAADDMVLAFRLRQVELGRDRWGRPVTSCTVDPLDADEAQALTPVKRLSGQERSILEGLREYAHDFGQPNPGGTGWPSPGRFRTVDEADFTEWAMGKSGAERGTDKRKAVRRAVESLIAGGVV